MIRRREIRYFEMPSPLGRLLVILSERGVLEIAFEGTAERNLWRLGRRIESELPPARVYGEPLEDELKKYFRADLSFFRAQPDLGLCAPFAAKVLTHLAELPPGRLTSYGELARETGKPWAARAVGQIVGSNPLPILIPCHRVTAGDGTLGGYSGGLARKRMLLEIEGIRPPRSGWAPKGRGRDKI